MTRGVIGLAVAAMAAGCGGSGAGGGTALELGKPWGATAPITAGLMSPYPVMWSRPLTHAPALLVTGLYVEPNSGDVVAAARLRGNAQMAGRRLERKGPDYDAVVARYDSADGTQMWTRHISAEGNSSVSGLGSDDGGNILVTVEYGERLFDELLRGLSPTSSFVAALGAETGRIEWFMELRSNAVRPGVVDGQLEIESPFADDTWTLPYDESTSKDPRVVVGVEGNVAHVAVFNSTGDVHVYDLDANGGIIQDGRVGRPRPSPDGLGGTVYQVRGEGDDNELVKLGPCDTEQCSYAVWR
jgi:hypothetical protein